jgi:hypothetical protein
MNNTYKIAGHRFRVSGENLCKAMESIDGFSTFLVEGDDALFSFVEGIDVPEIKRVQYEFSYEDIIGVFGKTADGFLLSLKPENEESLNLWHNKNEDKVLINGNLSAMLYRFALWIGFGLMTIPYNTVAIHSSCIVYNNKAILFLGESGTGKSTHTRLWRKNIEGAFLLNDDSPILRVEDNKIWAYGSPWSGKTPCYKQERYELKACVRLSQASYNQISKSSILQAYGAIHPSCPPEFAYDENLYEHISGFINDLLSKVPFYHLECLPDKEASLLSFKTIFGDEADTK